MSDSGEAKYNQPMGGNELPRFAGHASFFRLPVQTDAKGLDVALLGMPVDIGTSNRSGSVWAAGDSHRVSTSAPL